MDVYVPEESKVGEVEAILEAHGAYDLHYYGEWDLIDLSSNEPKASAQSEASAGQD